MIKTRRKRLVRWLLLSGEKRQGRQTIAVGFVEEGLEDARD